jgi:hypothetical protein
MKFSLATVGYGWRLFIARKHGLQALAAGYRGGQKVIITQKLIIEATDQDGLLDLCPIDGIVLVQPSAF